MNIIKYNHQPPPWPPTIDPIRIGEETDIKPMWKMLNSETNSTSIYPSISAEEAFESSLFWRIFCFSSFLFSFLPPSLSLFSLSSLSFFNFCEGRGSYMFRNSYILFFSLSPSSLFFSPLISLLFSLLLSPFSSIHYSIHFSTMQGRQLSLWV